MVFVDRHPVDWKKLRKWAKDEHEFVARWRKFFPTEPTATNLESSAGGIGKALDAIGAVTPTASVLVELARFICDVSAALFTWKRRGTRDPWLLADRSCVMKGDFTPESLSAGGWRGAFCLAWAIYDAEALALLSQVPVEHTEPWEVYERPTVLAMQSMFTHDPETGKRLIHAYELTDPEKATRTHPDSVLDGAVPALECLVKLAEGEAAPLEAAIARALDLYREMMIRFSKLTSFRGAPFEYDPLSGNVSIGGLGYLAWARAEGLTVAVESPYLPAGLMNLPAPPVHACPDCFTPVTTHCHACGRDGTGLRAMTFDGWYWGHREPCRQCAHRFHEEAVVCPVCGTRR